ncbi:MAG: hypothetical protein JXD22_12825 [Sedimentisphaerales bacterium]|nr:hypothetical protein [Sedimentisphaerales bacterium]
MFQTRNTGLPVGFLIMVLLGVFILSMVPGCKESTENQALRQSNENVDQAGRLIHGSNQQIVMNQSEINSAGSASGGRQEAVVQQVVDRIEQAGGVGDVEKALAELSEGVPAANDAQAIQVYGEKLAAVSRQLLNSREGMDSLSEQENKRRLDEAEKLLQQATSQAQQAGNSEAKSASEMLLGTMYLMKARENLLALRQQDLQIKKEQIKLPRLLAMINREQAVSQAILSELPVEKIAGLKKLLDGPESGLRGQLVKAEKNVAKLEGELAEIQQIFDVNDKKGAGLRREYMELVSRINQADGEERFRLQQQAYELRAGVGEGASRVEGYVYYESESEKAQNKLNVLQAQLDSEKLLAEQLRKSITQTEAVLAKLEEPGLTEAIQADNDLSKQRFQQNISLLTAPGQGQLDKIRIMENGYKELRVDTVTAYENSRKAFQRATKEARISTVSGKYADRMGKLATKELAGLWQQDVEHYEDGKLTLNLLGSVEMLQGMLSEARQEYDQQADAAQAQVQQLIEQVQE